MGTVALAYNPSTWEGDGEDLEFKANLSYIARSSPA